MPGQGVTVLETRGLNPIDPGRKDVEATRAFVAEDAVPRVRLRLGGRRKIEAPQNG